MIVDPCPFEPFVSVVQCSFSDGKVCSYRFVHHDTRRGRFTFFNLSYGGSSLDKMFVTVPVGDVEDIAEVDFRFMEDQYISERMRAEQPVMGKGVRRQWMKRWERIRSLVDLQFADDDLLEGRSIADIYSDRSWRNRLIKKQARRVGVKDETIGKIIATFVRHGGTQNALIPNTDKCGAKGKPRCLITRARKSGRLTTKQRRERARKGEEGITNARNRFSPFWNLRMNEAFDALIERDGPWAILVIKRNQEFLDYFYANHCWNPRHPDEGHRRTIDPRRIPSGSSLLYHRDRILRERPGLLQQNAGDKYSVGGSAESITYGALDIADLDGARFPQVRLVLADDEARDIPLSECIQIGEPVVIFGIARKSSAYVGWYLTLAERGEGYQHCIFNMLMDKVPRLRSLGLDPANFPGICSGAFDQVVVDRGAGASAKVMEWTVEGIKLDLRMARAGVPEDKGTVEGGIGRFKTHLRRNGILSRLVRRTVLRRARALPLGVLTLRRLVEARDAMRLRKANIKLVMTPKAFERLVVETINELNQKRRSSIAGMTERMLLSGVEPTPLSMHRYFQAQRRGNAAYARSDADLRASLLPRQVRTVVGGKIRVGPLHYGSPSSVPEGEEGAQALLAHVRSLVAENPNGRSVEITVVVEPYGNYVWWLRQPGDWVLLAPDVESANAWGQRRDFVERAGLEAHLAIERATAREKTVAKKLKTITAAQQQVIGDIERRRSETGQAKANVDKSARREAQERQRADHYDQSAAEVGLPPSTRIRQATPPAAAPVDQWAEPQSLAELFDSSEAVEESVDFGANEGDLKKLLDASIASNAKKRVSSDV